MVRILESKFISDGLFYQDLAGLKDDEKPVTGLITGSTFIEVDTGDVYMFDEIDSGWNKIGSSGGGNVPIIPVDDTNIA